MREVSVMEGFFYPKRVAIIGVSDSRMNLGRYVIKNLIDFGFNGSFYAVGLQGGTIYGMPIHKSIFDVPNEPDLALVVTKAEEVPDIAEECGKKGINRLVISTGGFSEYQPERETLEHKLLEVCQKYGIRFIGPNCLGVVNMENGLCLPFAPQVPANWKKGPVGVISQSGTLAVYYSQHLSHGKVGVSKVASVGNKLDLDEVDLLEYYLEDPQTEIVFLYLESLSRARELFELACSTRKPIIIHKSNTSLVSQGIAQSHTNALAADDKVLDFAFKQAGIIRVRSLDELLNCVKMLLLPPLKGNRLVVVSPGGGPAVVAADECQRNGFELPPLPQTFLDWLKSKARAGIISLTNPIDLGDIYDFDLYSQIFDRLLVLSEIDGIFFNLSYSPEWDQLNSYSSLLDYCNQVNSLSEIPVVIRAELLYPHALIDLNKRLSVPFVESTPGAFEAMRKVMDARQAKPILPSITETRGSEDYRPSISHEER